VNEKFSNNSQNDYIQMVQVQNFQNFAQLEQNWGKNLLKKGIIIQNEEVCTPLALKKTGFCNVLRHLKDKFWMKLNWTKLVQIS
jgi:hypothetical protein